MASFFDSMFSLKTLLGIVIFAGISLVIKLIKLYAKYRTKQKELHQVAADRARDDSLNSYILNSHATNPNKEAYVPYEVDYSNAPHSANSMNSFVNNNATMVQIVEQSKLSKRKFAMNASRGITIGTGPENDISFINTGGPEYKCKIFAINNQVFAANMLNSSPVLLKRKRNQAFIDDKGLKLNSNDSVLMGDYSYTINIVK